MNFCKMFPVLLILIIAVGLAGEQKQKVKPQSEWTAKIAEKILNDSPWCYTHTVTDLTKANTFSPSLKEIGVLGQSARIHYRIRFISAKPVRLAFQHLLLLDPRGADPVLRQKTQGFVDRKFEDVIVVGVDFDSSEPRLIGPATRTFGSAVTSTLANTAYLTVGEKRIFLKEYMPPDPARFGGAWFLFPRMVDGKPWIDEKTREVRFHVEFPPMPIDTRSKDVRWSAYDPSQSGTDPRIVLDWRFKVTDFFFNGILEY